MQQDDLNKIAATAIRSLQDENEKLASQLNTTEESIKLAFELYNKGIIVAEDLESKINELTHKTKEELEVLKKASEFTKAASFNSFFKLSQHSSGDSSLDPITRMLLEDI